MDVAVIMSHSPHRVMESPPSWTDDRNAYTGNDSNIRVSSVQNQSRIPQKEVIDRSKYIIKPRPIDAVNSTSFGSDGEYADTLKYRLRLKEAWKKSFLLNLYGTDEKVKWNRRPEKLDDTAIRSPSAGKQIENPSSKITPRQKFEMLHNRVSRKVTANLRHPNTEEDKQSSAHTTLVTSNSQNKEFADSTKSFSKESPRAKFERHRAARSHVVNPSYSHTFHATNNNKCDDLYKTRTMNNGNRMNEINNGNRMNEMVATSHLDSGDASISATATSKLFLDKQKVDYYNNMNGVKTSCSHIRSPSVKTNQKEIYSNDVHDILLPTKSFDINLVPPRSTCKIISNTPFIVNMDITDKPCPTAPSNTAAEQRKINLDLDGPVPRYGSSAISSWGREGESESFHVTHGSKETHLASPHANVSRSDNIDIASPHSCGTSSSGRINLRPILRSTRIVNDSQVCCSSNHKALGCCDKRCCDTTCNKEDGSSIHVGKCHFSSDNINANDVTSHNFVANNGLDRCRCLNSRCEKCSKETLEVPRPVRNSTTIIRASGSVSSSGYESEHTVSRNKHSPRSEIRNKINGYQAGGTPTSIIQELRFRFNQPICVSKDNNQLQSTYSVKSNTFNQHVSSTRFINTFNQHVSSDLESRSPWNLSDSKYNSSTCIPHVNAIHTDVNNDYRYKNNHCISNNSSLFPDSQQNCRLSTQPSILNGEQEACDEHHNWLDASVSYPTVCGQDHHIINSCRQRETTPTYHPLSLSLDNRDILSHRNISIKEATMLASKGLRIYEYSNECLPQDRQATSSFVQNVSEPKVSWKAASYLIVPTVMEPCDNSSRRNKGTRDQSCSSVFDVLAHRSISDSGTNVIQDEINNGAHSDGDVCSDNEYTSMSRDDPSSNMRARAMSVDLICKEDASDFRQDISKVTTRIKRKDRRQSRGYVEWDMCSGWIGDVGKNNSMKRNSRGYVEWDTIWTPAVAFKGDDINDEHVYDVINDEQSELLIQEQATTEIITLVADSKDVVADSKECDAPPALPERTYINRLKQVDTTSEHRHRRHSPRCHHHQRQNNHHRHHHHHHHHHRHHRRHSHSPSGRRCQGGSSPSSSNNASSKLKSPHRPSHGDHHQPPPLPLSQPPPPLPPPNPPHQSSDNSQNYAQVHKLKGYTFGSLMTSQESAHIHQSSDRSAVYSENYCHLQPVSSEERMTLWKSGDVLNYIDGLHESMSPKSRENIYILLNNKKTRAKFSESLEIESRLLSKGLLSASVSKMDIDATSRLKGTHAVTKIQKGEAEVKKRPKVPVSSTYV